MKNKKEKKQKTKFEDLDDNRTVANMNVEGFKWYKSDKEKAAKEDLRKLKVTKKERKAITKAAYLSVIPIIIMYLSAFILLFLLILWWLN